MKQFRLWREKRKGKIFIPFRWVMIPARSQMKFRLRRRESLLIDRNFDSSLYCTSELSLLSFFSAPSSSSSFFLLLLLGFAALLSLSTFSLHFFFFLGSSAANTCDLPLHGPNLLKNDHSTVSTVLVWVAYPLKMLIIHFKCFNRERWFLLKLIPIKLFLLKTYFSFSLNLKAQPRPPPFGTITTLLDHLNRRPSLHANLLSLQLSQPFLSVPSTDR